MLCRLDTKATCSLKNAPRKAHKQFINNPPGPCRNKPLMQNPTPLQNGCLKSNRMWLISPFLMGSLNSLGSTMGIKSVSKDHGGARGKVHSLETGVWCWRRRYLFWVREPQRPCINVEAVPSVPSREPLPESAKEYVSSLGNLLRVPWKGTSSTDSL